MASCMSATPWPVEPVAARAPVAAAPSAMFTPSISVSAWIITPPAGSAAARERVEQPGERQHRVAGEEPAADVDRGFGDRVVALAEHERHSPTSAPSSTTRRDRSGRPRTRKSGQTSAQARQPGAAVEETRQHVALRVANVGHLEHARHADGNAEAAALAAIERHRRRCRARGARMRSRPSPCRVTKACPASSAARSACSAATRCAGTSSGTAPASASVRRCR